MKLDLDSKARMKPGPISVWASRPVVYAILAVALSFCWQTVTVHSCYGGNWTGLFCAGDHFHNPPVSLSNEHIYRFKSSYGYDGQQYHYMAHDPFLWRGFQSSLDSPRFRYRRILPSFLAWLMAGGQDNLVDVMYFGLVLVFVFLGVYWTSNVIRSYAGHPAWALGFLLIPGVTASLDRMTIDVALVAFTAGAVYYLQKKNDAALIIICALSGLVRESGLLIPAAVAAWHGLQRRFRSAVVVAMCAIPTFGWYTYIQPRTPEVTVTYVSWFPFQGPIVQLARLLHRQFNTSWNALVTPLDYAALLGVMFAVVYCLTNASRLFREPDGIMAFAYVALAGFVSNSDVWIHAYGFGRACSPLLLLVALDSFRVRSLLGLLPTLLVGGRIVLALQLVAQSLHLWMEFGT